jgi:hypothetical protein
VLKLNREDAAAFDEVLAEQPAPIRNGVKKSTQADAERIAASFLQSRKTQGIDTTANSVAAGGPGSTLTGDEGLEHANPLHPGASKDKETDGSAEPEFGPELDKIDSTDGDDERKLERNTPVQESLQASVGGTTGSDPDATGASVAEEESARNQAAPQTEESAKLQEVSAASAATPEPTTKKLFGIGKGSGDKPETQPVREGAEG